VTLAIQGAGDATTMYLREWHAQSRHRRLECRPNSGWLNSARRSTGRFHPARREVRGHLGAPPAGNVSTLDESGLFLVNRWDGNQVPGRRPGGPLRGNLDARAA